MNHPCHDDLKSYTHQDCSTSNHWEAALCLRYVLGALHYKKYIISNIWVQMIYAPQWPHEHGVLIISYFSALFMMCCVKWIGKLHIIFSKYFPNFFSFFSKIFHLFWRKLESINTFFVEQKSPLAGTQTQLVCHELDSPDVQCNSSLNVFIQFSNYVVIWPHNLFV